MMTSEVAGVVKAVFICGDGDAVQVVLSLQESPVIVLVVQDFRHDWRDAESLDAGLLDNLVEARTIVRLRRMG